MPESLSLPKRALLERWKAGTRHREAELLSQRDQRDEAPLTFGQERLWLLEQLFPGTSAFNLSFCCWIDGSLDLAALSSSAEALARRHESIRTRIRLIGGVPRQVISERAAPHLEVADLSGLGPPDQREREALRLATEAAREPFDLEEGPLARMKVFLVGEQRTLMLFVIHHAIADGWSLGVALRDLVAFYEATLLEKNSVLPALPIQFGDYASWQRDPRRVDEWRPHIEYWKRRLGEFSGFELPLRSLRPSLQRLDGAFEEFVIGESLSRRIRAVSRDLGVTPFMTLLAGFQGVLGRIVGAEDVAVATPVSGRKLEETHDLIGEFINILIMRTALAGNPTFRELIMRVRETSIGAYAHQDVPMELVEASLNQPGVRDVSGTPFTQILFVLQNSPMPTLQLAGDARLVPVELEWGTARYDIELYLWDGRPAFTGRLQYRTDLVDQLFARRICHRLEGFLEAAVGNPDRRLHDLPLLTADEQLPIATGSSRHPACNPPSPHRTIEARAEEYPEKVAVICGQNLLTCARLNAESNRVANALLGRGVAPGTVVGIVSQPDQQGVVAILGTLKAGAAPLPFDPDLTLEGMEAAFFQARPRFLLTRSDKRLPFRADIPSLDLDDAIRLASASPVSERIGESAATLILTSANHVTGTRAVVHTYRDLWTQAVAMKEKIGIGKQDVILNATSFSSPLFIANLFLAFAAEAAIALAPSNTMGNAERLRAYLEATGSTVAQFTPSVWRLLLEAGWPGNDRLIAVEGGETAPTEIALRLTGRTRAIWRAYGMPEAGIWTILEDASGSREGSFLLHSLADAKVQVLDAWLQPVPVGSIGEIHVGGVGLAQYYCGEAALTAERFLPDPFSSLPGARLFATGDLGMRLDDGSIEVLVPVDDWKSGARPESFKVERILRDDRDLKDAALVTRATSRGAESFAFVVPAHVDESRMNASANGNCMPGSTWASGEGDATELIERIRERLSARLAEHLIPRTLIVVPSLPLDAEGRVNRAALRTGDPRQLAHAPRTRTERVIAETWQHVLGLEWMPLRTSWFELGASSAATTQALGVLRREFALAIPMGALFEHPTVELLARHLETVARYAQLPPIRRRPRPAKACILRETTS